MQYYNLEIVNRTITKLSREKDKTKEENPQKLKHTLFLFYI